MYKDEYDLCRFVTKIIKYKKQQQQHYDKSIFIFVDFRLGDQVFPPSLS